MLIPLEVALLFGALGVMMVRHSVGATMSNIERVSHAIIGMGSIMTAVAGRFPPGPSDTGLSPFVMVGVWVSLVGFALHIAGSIASLVQKLIRFHRGPKRLK